MDQISFYANTFDEEKFVKDLALASFRIKGRFIIDRYIYYKNGHYKNTELYLAKSYPDTPKEIKEEYFHLYTGEEYPEIEVYKEKKVICLGSTVSGTEAKRLAIELCIEYLKLNPEHILVSGDAYVYTLEHLLKAQEKQEYYWCYKTPEELLSS